jgi:hypothetical protein
VIPGNEEVVRQLQDQYSGQVAEIVAVYTAFDSNLVWLLLRFDDGSLQAVTHSLVKVLDDDGTVPAD